MAKTNLKVLKNSIVLTVSWRDDAKIIFTMKPTGFYIKRSASTEEGFASLEDILVPLHSVLTPQILNKVLRDGLFLEKGEAEMFKLSEIVTKTNNPKELLTVCV